MNTYNERNAQHTGYPTHYKCLRALIIFFIITGWFYSGWPRIWQNPKIPPEIKVAHAAYYDVISALNPDFWWKLDGNENDSADSANSDAGNDPDWVSSIIPTISSTNQCGDYNGSDDETDIPNQSKINSATTYKKSISVWVYADTIDSTHRVIWGEGGSSNGLTLHVYNGTLYFNIYEGSTRDTLTTSISTETLYHIGATMDCTAGTMYLYIDGSQVASKTGGLNISTSFTSHAAGAAIGGADSTLDDENGGSMSGVFNGRIADVVYWGEQDVLNESDFNSIYEAGAGVANNPPSLTVSTPPLEGASVTVGDTYNITYTLSDSEETVTAKFFYDSDSSGLDGTAIAGCEAKGEGTDLTCSWDTTGVTPDNYYIYATTTDGVNPEVNDYSPGELTVSAAPATVSCSSNIGSTDFGTWTTGSTEIKTSSPNASTTMSCSGTSDGCTLYVKDAGSGADPGLWNSSDSSLIESPNAAYSTTAVLSAGTEGYGIQATTTSAGLGIATRYNQTGNTVGGLTLTNQTLASSTADISGAEVIMTHKAAISETTYSGTYTDTITYECTVN